MIGRAVRAIQASEVDDAIEHSPTPNLERIEQPDLDVGMRIERGDGGVETDGVIVVEQQPHADAPVGGAV